MSKKIRRNRRKPFRRKIREEELKYLKDESAK